MKGMDIMATRGVMPLGAEQANVLQGLSGAGEGQDMSFAKRFGEIATGAARSTLAASSAKGANVPAGSMEKLLNISAGEDVKAASTPANATLVKSGDVAQAGTASHGHAWCVPLLTGA